MNQYLELAILYLFVGISFLWSIDKTSKPIESFILRLVDKVRYI